MSGGQRKESHLAVAEFSTALYSSALIFVENPKGNGYVGCIEHLARKNNDCFYLITFDKIFADFYCIFIVKCTIGKQKAGSAIVWFELGKHM